ncbi:hypothetical protein F4802DRAFT_590468 [Xylaria palmicola]|nr:hypothetical protein F4802DRAFT_590468 [Xylaria palmicola]
MNNNENAHMLHVTKSKYATPHIPRPLWTPIWFRKATLFAFMVAFTLSWVALIILWRYDLSNNGIAISPFSVQYSWTYGPTVLLTIATALWRQLDYHCKLSKPWQTMRSGPTSSNKSMLLDYISPFQAISFYRALKAGHWSVLASILGFTILKVAMVISTALLVSLPTKLSESVPVITTSNFNDSSLWHAVKPASEPGRAIVYPDDARTGPYHLPSPGPIFAYQGVLNGLSDPTGTQGGITFQTIDSPGVKASADRVSARVHAFIPQIDCEEARTTFYFGPDPFDTLTIANVTLDSPSCSVGHFATTVSVLTCRNSASNPTIVRVNCSEDFSISTIENSDYSPPDILINDKTPYDLRLAIIAMDTTDCGNEKANWDTTPPAATGAICKIDYTIQQVELVHDLVLDRLQLDISNDSTSSYRFPNMTGLELGQMIISLVIYSDDGQRFPNLMTKALHDPTASPTWFLNQSALTDTAQEVLKGLAAQLMESLLVVPVNQTINGTSIYTEERLHLQPIALWGLVASFIILSLLPLAIIFTVSDGSVSQCPGPIAAHAALLACSPSVQKLLAQTGHLRTSEITKWLDGHVFKTALNDDGRFEIRALGQVPLFYKPGLPSQKPSQVPLRRTNSESPRRSSLTMRPQDLVTKSRTWVPLAIRLPFVILTFSLPILSIVSLEILYQQSERNQGFAVKDQSLLPLYTRYPTSGIILFVATMFNSMDFTISGFAPFTTLRSYPTSARPGLLTNLLGEIPVAALYKSFGNKQYGSSLSILASLVGTVLSIVASGLWVIDPDVVIRQPIISYPTSFWDLTWENSSSADGGAADLLQNILFKGSQGSDGVWQDLVFPALGEIQLARGEHDGIPQIEMSNPDKPSTYNLSVPALRPLLNCDPIPQDDFEFTKIDSDFAQFSGVAQLPPHCLAGPNGDRNYVMFQKINFSIDQGPKWFGWFQDLHLGPWDDDPEKGFSDVGEDAIYDATGFIQPDNQNGCPSIAVFFAHLEPAKPSTANITGLVCSQRIQKVNTQVTFRPDGTGLIKSQNLISDPVPLESSARYLTNGTKGVDSFNYRVEVHFQLGFLDWDFAALQNEGLDSFFEKVVLGGDGTPLEAMVGPENLDTLQNAVNTLYKKYMAEVINSPIFVRNFTNSESLQLAPATGTVNTTVSRLKVDFISKLVLQIMLAMMVILGGLALRLAKVKGTLPRLPFSIASVMGLLSESTLSSRSIMPNGAEWMNEKQLEKALGERTFGLGWWGGDTNEQIPNDRPDGPRRYGIDIGKPQATELQQDEGTPG